LEVEGAREVPGRGLVPSGAQENEPHVARGADEISEHPEALECPDGFAIAPGSRR
jgi:hypothetical protein